MNETRAHATGEPHLVHQDWPIVHLYVSTAPGSVVLAAYGRSAPISASRAKATRGWRREDLAQTR